MPTYGGFTGFSIGTLATKMMSLQGSMTSFECRDVQKYFGYLNFKTSEKESENILAAFNITKVG